MNARAFGSRRRSGFTLIELLTVIAIIAILAALLFPVFAGMGRKMRETQCQNNLKAIVQAMNVYKEDHGVYPDALYGVGYTNGLELRLAKQVKDPGIFTCPEHPQQFKQSDTLVPAINPMTGQPATDRYNRPMLFPQRSSYDIQYRPNQASGTAILNYNLKWTGWAQNQTGAGDQPRQLAYKNPPDNTVVAICLNHAKPGAAVNGVFPVGKGEMAIVAFLNGRVQKIPAEQVNNWTGQGQPYPWLVMPKP
ncbi:MAG: type II secretion system protein [Armatimonadota bacterium]